LHTDIAVLEPLRDKTRVLNEGMMLYREPFMPEFHQ
jgi:hypothetical protein